MLIKNKGFIVLFLSLYEEHLDTSRQDSNTYCNFILYYFFFNLKVGVNVFNF